MLNAPAATRTVDLHSLVGGCVLDDASGRLIRRRSVSKFPSTKLVQATAVYTWSIAALAVARKDRRLLRGRVDHRTSSARPPCYMMNRRIQGEHRRYCSSGVKSCQLTCLSYCRAPDDGSLINRLPPEILTKVLEFHEQEDDLFAATHVCRYWRSTLVSAPCLWTRVPCNNMNQAAIYLERSKSAPIDVAAEFTPATLSKFPAMESIIPHLGRVRLMRIHPRLGETIPAVFKFRSPAPLLQHLAISRFPRGHMSRLPRDFLGCHVPSLRSLRWDDSSLLSTPFPPPSPIRLPYDPNVPPAPLQVVLGLISSAPHLEDLSILIPYADEVSDPFPVQDIHLSSLHRLEWVSGPVFCRVLPYFKVPHLKELSIFLPFDTGGSTMADLLPSHSFPLVTVITSMDFHAGPGDSGIKLAGEGVKVTMFTGPPHMDNTDNFFSVAPFSLAQITKLTLRMTAKPMATRIGDFVSLERLELIRCEEDAEVLSDLSPSPDLGSFIRCPHLATIKVAFCYPARPIVDSFRWMVMLRKEVGNPLTSIDVMPFDAMSEILDVEALGGWLRQAPVVE